MADAKMVGLAKALAKLNALPAAVKEGVRPQLEKEVDGLVQAMKDLAPTSELEAHGGDLRESIHKEPSKNRDLSFLVIADPRDDKGRVYSAHVEFGHRTKDGRHVPAQSFFFPVYRALRKGIKNRMRNAGRRSIKSITKGG